MDLSPTHLEATLLAIQAHGKLQSLNLKWCYGRDAWGAPWIGGLAPGCFQGLRKVTLAVSLPYMPFLLRNQDNFMKAVQSIVSALDSNTTLQEVDLTLPLATPGLVPRLKLITDILQTMPLLEVFHVDTVDHYLCPLPGYAARLVLVAVSKSDSLHTFNDNQFHEAVSNRLINEIAYHCERNRVGVAQLLARDPPTSLWPFILSRVGHQSVLYELLCGNPDLMKSAGIDGRSSGMERYIIPE
jgi:hypothetical protein